MLAHQPGVCMSQSVCTVQVVMMFIPTTCYLSLKRLEAYFLSKMAPFTHPVHCYVQMMCGAKHSFHLELMEL